MIQTCEWKFTDSCDDIARLVRAPKGSSRWSDCEKPVRSFCWPGLSLAPWSSHGIMRWRMAAASIPFKVMRLLSVVFPQRQKCRRQVVHSVMTSSRLPRSNRISLVSVAVQSQMETSRANKMDLVVSASYCCLTMLSACNGSLFPRRLNLPTPNPSLPQLLYAAKFFFPGQYVDRQASPESARGEVDPSIFQESLS